MRRLSSLMLAGGLAVAMTGCDEFLEPNPQTFAASTTYYSTPQQFEQAAAGLYSNLRGLFGGNWRNLTDFRADVATLQYNTGVPGFTFVIDEFAENSVDNNVSGQWQTVFQAIFDANVILTRIDAVTFPSAAQKDRIVAEAKFIRALAMWQGLQFWGLGEGWDPAALAIPIITVEVTEPAAAFEIERATVQQVYDQIIKDLTEAKPALPLRTEGGATGNNAGRITRGAAAFLLGATYQLNPAAAAQTAALAQFNELAGQGYALRPTHRELFSPANKNNSESILEVQYTGAASVTNNALFQNLVGGMSPLNSAGGGNQGSAQRIAPFGTAGGGGYMPTPDLVLSYAGANPASPATPVDTRYRDDYGAFCPGSGTSGVLGVADVIATGQGANTNWPDLNIASLRDPQTGATRTNCIAYWIKWRWPDQGGLVLSGRDNNNWIAFRYADALLRIAEANWRLGNSAAALTALNMVRARAGVPALAGLSGTALRDAIAEERKLELAGEGHRWFDLKRLGIATQVIEAHGNFLRARNNAGTTRARVIQPDAYRLSGAQAFRLRYPVRPRDVTLSGGKIQQNPGWAQ